MLDFTTLFSGWFGWIGELIAAIIALVTSIIGVA